MYQYCTLQTETSKVLAESVSADCWVSQVCGKGQIPLRYPGRRQVRSLSQTCSELEFGLSLAAS